MSERSTILVVEDDPQVQTLLGLALKQMGFNTISASDGREGLDHFTARPDEIHCVLLDLTMPVIDGRETLRRLRLLSDSVPVVLMSGYTSEAVCRELESDGVAGFVHKPFRFDRLAGVIREAIAGCEPSTPETGSPA